MGRTRQYASKLQLTTMIPRSDLSSTRYALANPGSEYLIYQPVAEAFTVSLISGTYYYEWFDPKSGKVVSQGSIVVDEGETSFTAPFGGDAVLYLRR